MVTELVEVLIEVLAGMLAEMTVYTLDKRNHRILSINIFLYRAYKFYKKNQHEGVK